MRRLHPGSATPLNTVIILLLLLSLLSFPMFVSAAQRPQSWMRKRIDAQPGPGRAPPDSSPAIISSSTITTPSTKAPTSTSVKSSTSTSTSTPTPTPTTRAPTTRTPTAPPSPQTTSSLAVTSSTSSSVVFTTSTSTHSLPPSISTIQSSSSTSSTPTTLSIPPTAATTFSLPSPLTLPTSFGQIPQISTSAIPAAHASTSTSPKSFFANTGAVAGTFTVVGLAVVGLLVALFIYFFKRRRTPEDDDDAFFEKIPGPASYDGNVGHRGLGSLSPVYPPAATTAYADNGYARTTNVHGGGHNYEPEHAHATNVHDGGYNYEHAHTSNSHGGGGHNYESEHAHATDVHGGSYNYEPEQNGMQYPSRSAYTTQQHQDAYVASRRPRSTSPPSHPYARPFDSPTSNESPVNARASSIAYGVVHDSADSFYGGRD